MLPHSISPLGPEHLPSFAIQVVNQLCFRGGRGIESFDLPCKIYHSSSPVTKSDDSAQITSANSNQIARNMLDAQVDPSAASHYEQTAILTNRPGVEGATGQEHVVGRHRAVRCVWEVQCAKEKQGSPTDSDLSIAGSNEVDTLCRYHHFAVGALILRVVRFASNPSHVQSGDGQQAA
jgi:hypothetical protein